MLPTSRAYLNAFYGTLLAGGVPVPLYPPARLTTIEDHMTRHVGILKNAGASIMITIPEAKALAYLLRAQVESLRAVLMPSDLEGDGSGFLPARGKSGDLGFLQYTSGSTGSPKGVVLTHANLLVNVRAMGKAVDVTPDDVFVSWLPLYHDMGLIGGCFATMFLGFPVVLMSPLAFLSHPGAWLRAIHRHRGTISGGPNFCYELCLRRIPDEQMEGVDLASWRFAFNGAEPVSPETIRAFTEKFARWGFRQNAMAPVYGLAECTVGLAFTSPGEPWRMDALDREHFSMTGEAREASAGDASPLKVVGCGRVLEGHDLRVVDAAGLELPDGNEGSAPVSRPLGHLGLLPQPVGHQVALRRRVAQHRRPRLPARRHGLHHRPREGHHHPRRAQRQPLELEQAVGDLAGVRRGCVAVFGTPRSGLGHRAHGGARRDARRRRLAPRRPQAHDQRAGDQPHRRARRRHRARAAGHRAQDLERQDPPHRGARVLRARAGRGEAAGGVAAVRAPHARRRRAAAAAHGARAARRAVRPARLRRLRASRSPRRSPSLRSPGRAPPGAPAARSRASSCAPRASRPCCRGRSASRRARWWSRPTTRATSTRWCSSPRSGRGTTPLSPSASSSRIR
jgi:hypothetical protein